MNPNNLDLHFTSDWHVGEPKIISIDSRPFRDLAHMHATLINNYNAQVGEHGVCYFLGDLGLTKDGILKDIITQLNGTKILIKGNHDKKGIRFYLDCGFAAVLNHGSILIGKHLVTMSHCPLLGVFRENVTGMQGAIPGDNWHGETRHNIKFSSPDMGQPLHLHGHIHSPNKGKSKRVLGKQLDVGLPANNYRPVSFKQIQSHLARLYNEPPK